MAEEKVGVETDPLNVVDVGQTPQSAQEPSLPIGII